MESSWLDILLSERRLRRGWMGLATIVFFPERILDVSFSGPFRSSSRPKTSPSPSKPPWSSDLTRPPEGRAGNSIRRLTLAFTLRVQTSLLILPSGISPNLGSAEREPTWTSAGEGAAGTPGRTKQTPSGPPPGAGKRWLSPNRLCRKKNKRER